MFHVILTPSYTKISFRTYLKNPAYAAVSEPKTYPKFQQTKTFLRNITHVFAFHTVSRWKSIYPRMY